MQKVLLWDRYLYGVYQNRCVSRFRLIIKQSIRARKRGCVDGTTVVNYTLSIGTLFTLAPQTNREGCTADCMNTIAHLVMRISFIMLHGVRGVLPLRVDEIHQCAHA